MLWWSIGIRTIDRAGPQPQGLFITYQRLRMTISPIKESSTNTNFRRGSTNLGISVQGDSLPPSTKSRIITEPLNLNIGRNGAHGSMLQVSDHTGDLP